MVKILKTDENLSTRKLFQGSSSVQIENDLDQVEPCLGIFIFSIFFVFRRGNEKVKKEFIFFRKEKDTTISL